MAKNKILLIGGPLLKIQSWGKVGYIKEFNVNLYATLFHCKLAIILSYSFIKKIF